MVFRIYNNESMLMKAGNDAEDLKYYWVHVDTLTIFPLKPNELKKVIAIYYTEP